jgi:hypothetical protein
MTVRPHIEEETVETVDKKLRGRMRVDPEKVAMDEKIRILVGELEELEDSLEEQQDVNENIDELRNEVRMMKNEAVSQSNQRM